MTVRPHLAPCLRCVFPETPMAGSGPTCDTAGVIMPVISIVSSVQVSEAMKLLTGNFEKLHGSLMQFDVWRNECRRISLGEPAVDCPTCAKGIYETLEAEAGGFAAVLCGRNEVQVAPPRRGNLDFHFPAHRLRGPGDVQVDQNLLPF